MDSMYLSPHVPSLIPGCCDEDARARGWLAFCQIVKRVGQMGLEKSVHELQKHTTGEATFVTQSEFCRVRKNLGCNCLFKQTPNCSHNFGIKAGTAISLASQKCT